jgi:DNA-binding beta-propeller fold protein YncE
MFRIGICILFACLLITSCAPIPKDIPPELYWPTPPERTRIKFIDYIESNLDVVGEEGAFKRMLFGSQEEETFRKPSFVAVKDGVMYVTDINRIFKFDIMRHEFKVIGTGLLRNATGIDVTSDGKIYVADSMLKKIIIIEGEELKATALGGTGEFVSPGGLVVDEQRGRFLVVDTKKHVVYAYTLEGKYLFSIGSRGGGAGEFNFPYDITVDKEGYIYVIDSGNFRVQIFGPEGNFINTFGSVGALPGLFSRPKGIAIDSEGHIYVVDAAFGNIQIFDVEGRIYLDVGKSGEEPGMFLLPMGIYIDEEDKLYVVDQINRRVQIFQYLKYPNEEHLKPKKPSELMY